MSQPLSNEEKDRLFETLDAQTETLNELKRGLYGDKNNSVPGLIHEMSEMKKWRNNLKLRMAFVSGAFISVWELVKLGVEYLKPTNHN